MFTGIVEHSGKIVRIQRTGDVTRLVISAGPVAKPTKEGDSIAVNGVCLTVTKKNGATLSFDMAPETIKRTNLSKLKSGDEVNLERAIRAGEPFGGHFVQGHIDTTGKITAKTRKGESYVITVSIPTEFRRFLIEKGSIAIDGISLTITGITSSGFSIAVIPYTIKHTTLNKKTTGDTVNIEVDMLGKWLSQLLPPFGGAHLGKSRIDTIPDNEGF